MGLGKVQFRHRNLHFRLGRKSERFGAKEHIKKWPAPRPFLGEEKTHFWSRVQNPSIFAIFPPLFSLFYVFALTTFTVRSCFFTSHEIPSGPLSKQGSYGPAARPPPGLTAPHTNFGLNADVAPLLAHTGVQRKTV